MDRLLDHARVKVISPVTDGLHYDAGDLGRSQVARKVLPAFQMPAAGPDPPYKY